MVLARSRFAMDEPSLHQHFAGDTRFVINTLRRDEKYILCNVHTRNLKEINPAI
jgi:hypothetical protein